MFSNLAESGFQRFCGTMPPANAAPVTGSFGQADGASEEKFPVRCASVGTVQVFAAPWRSRLKSSPTKKKSLLLSFFNSLGMKTGPPRFQPKLLNRSSGIVSELKARA